MRKLSDLGTDECLDVLCTIAPSIQAIVEDKDIMTALGKAIDKKGLTKAGVLMTAASKLVGAVPLLFKAHREDVYNILSSVGGVTVEDVKAQNMLDTMQQLREILQDKPLLDFFGWSKRGDSGV
nr:MAG TPA: hypothetical protein [Caudoviricetes sp.]